MFEVIFGPAAPIFIASVITAFTQWIKAGYVEITGKEIPTVAVQGIVVLLNWIFGIPYHIMNAGEFTWWVPFEGLLYSTALAFYSMGLYTAYDASATRIQVHRMQRMVDAEVAGLLGEELDLDGT